MRYGSRRAVALACAAALGLVGVVLVLSPGQAAPPTSGDRIAHWSKDAGGATVVDRADVAAPSGQRFTEVFPIPNVDNVVTLTDRQELHVYGSANLNVPSGLDGSRVRDVDVTFPVLGVVAADGRTTTWNRFSGEPVPRPPSDLCAATQVSLASTDLAAVRCEDGSVEVFDDDGNRWSVPAELPDVTAVQASYLAGGAGPIVRVVLEGGKVMEWRPSASAAPVTAVENTIAQGKQVVSLTSSTAVTTSGTFLDLGISAALGPTRPVRRGGADAALLAKPIAAVSVAPTGAGLFLTRDGDFDGWSADNPVDRDLRKLPTRLAGETLAGVGSSDGHQAVIVSDTDAPEGPKVVEPSSVRGDTNGAVRPGDTLTGTAATFHPASDDVTTQWLVDGKPVEGTEDQATFAVTAEHLEHTIAFRTSAAFPGSGAPLVSDSSTVTVVTKDRPSVVKASGTEGFPAAAAVVYGTFATFSEETEDRETYWLVDDDRLAGQGTADRKELALTDEMVGKKVRFVTVGYFADDVEVTSRSEPVTVRKQLAEVSPPSIEGSPQVGSRLTIKTPAVFNDDSSDVTISHTWYRDFAEVVGHGETYTLTKDDIGSTINYSAEAIRPGEAFPAYSFDFTGVGPVMKAQLGITGKPVVEGDPVVGRTVTVAPAPFSDEDATATYQWLVDGSPIDGATGTSLQLPEQLGGKEVSVRQTVARDGATTAGPDFAQATSEPRTVRAKPVDLVVAKAASVSGKRVVGQTITGTPATFSDPEADVTSYWVIDGRRTAASGTTLTLTGAHVGSSIRFASVAERSEDDATADSVSEDQVGPVLAEVEVRTATKVSGTAKVGRTLTATPATFTGDEVTVEGSWWAGDTKLDQGGITLRLTADLEGAVITFRTVATRTVDGIEERKVSQDSSAKVAPADADPGEGTDPEPPAPGTPETDLVQGSTTVERGDVLTLDLGRDRAGDRVRVVLFSRPVTLGTPTVAADGTVEVTIPTSVPLGKHRLAVYDASGGLIGYQTITVVAPAAAPGAAGPGGGTVAPGGTLPDTGAGAGPALLALGLGLVLAGGSVVAHGRRRRPRHRVG